MPIAFPAAPTRGLLPWSGVGHQCSPLPSAPRTTTRLIRAAPSLGSGYLHSRQPGQFAHIRRNLMFYPRHAAERIFRVELVEMEVRERGLAVVLDIDAQFGRLRTVDEPGWVAHAVDDNVRHRLAEQRRQNSRLSGRMSAAAGNGIVVDVY